MRAFIEYPGVSQDRLEITGEFTLETKAHRYQQSLERVVDRFGMKVEVTTESDPVDDAVYSVEGMSEENARDYWDERMNDEDFDRKIGQSEPVELEVNIKRDSYWKDEC